MPVPRTVTIFAPSLPPDPAVNPDRVRRYFHGLRETILGVARRRGGAGRFIFGVVLCLGFGGAAGKAAPVPEVKPARWWRFDETVVGVDAALADAGPSAAHLTLGRGAKLVPGHSGGALRPGLESGQPAAWREPHAGGGLPAADWTLAFWLWLDRDAGAEGVVFETGAGPRDRSELLQRVSVLPRESALLFSAPAVDPGPATVGRRVEFSRPDGPPHGVALVQSVTLASDGAPWPRAMWLRIALVYDATAGQLRLVLGGRVRAVAAFRLEALPPGSVYLAVGGDGRGGRPLRGAIDDLQWSDAADDGFGLAVPARSPRNVTRP